MGLISTFKKNDRVAGRHSPQSARWNIVDRDGQRCFYLQVYRSEDEDCSGDPPQQMVFQPNHISEFRKILAEWDKR